VTPVKPKVPVVVIAKKSIKHMIKGTTSVRDGLKEVIAKLEAA